MHLSFSWISFFIFAVLSLNLIKKWKMGMRSNHGVNVSNKKLPPGPRKLPLIGNIHQLMGSLPHQALKNLAQKHGDLMHLQLGEISAVVASSPQMAKMIMTKHDIAFANRPEILVGKIILYNYADITFSPYSDYWRQMRKICALELLSPKSVRSLSPIRQDEVSRLVSSIQKESLLRSEQGVNLTGKLFTYTSSMVLRSAFGRAYGQHRDKLLELLKEIMSWSSGFDVSELFPSWKIFQRMSRIEPKLVEVHNKFDEFLEYIIQEHVDNPTGRNGEFGQEDLIDVLLRIKQSGDLHVPITNTNIKAILADMFIGGTETSSTLVEWTMAELMRNPNVLGKAQAEIRNALFLQKKTTLEEADIQNFNYLKLVIKETLRLHPPVPLLVPRENKEPCEIEGYIIPPKTRVMINVWAIGRDPKYWDDPLSFRPERFENSNIDFSGIDYKFLPFGGGKRMCPGVSFALANVEVPLTNLLCYFDWKLPNNMKCDELDMTETGAITMARKNQLVLVASRYESLAM